MKTCQRNGQAQYPIDELCSSVSLNDTLLVRAPVNLVNAFAEKTILRATSSAKVRSVGWRRYDRPDQRALLS